MYVYICVSVCIYYYIFLLLFNILFWECALKSIFSRVFFYQFFRIFVVLLQFGSIYDFNIAFNIYFHHIRVMSNLLLVSIGHRIPMANKANREYGILNSNAYARLTMNLNCNIPITMLLNYCNFGQIKPCHQFRIVMHDCILSTLKHHTKYTETKRKPNTK